MATDILASRKIASKKEYCLTVDWDFFFEENTLWDWGHAESELFHSLVWTFRTQAEDHTELVNEPNLFWQKIASRYNVNIDTVYVTDSHLHAYEIASGYDRLLLIDTHHDVWEPPREDTKVYLDCGSWLNSWLNGDTTRVAFFDQSDSGKKNFPVPDEYKSRVRETRLHPSAEITSLHICRSSCWMPPWFDGEFIQFVERAKKMFRVEETIWGKWEPMKERWSEHEYASLIEELEELVKKGRSV